MILPAGTNQPYLLSGCRIRFAAHLICQKFFHQTHLVPALCRTGFLNAGQIHPALSVQYLPADKLQLLAGFALYRKLQISGNILSEIQYSGAILSLQQYRTKTFLLPNRHIIRCRQYDICSPGSPTVSRSLHHSGRTSITGLLAGIVNFPIF